MPNHSSNDPFESTLDSLFKAPPRISADFTERTIARVHAENVIENDWLEEWIEEELASFHVEPSIDFTERTLQRAQRQKADLIRFPLPLIIRTATGIAAAIAVLFAIGHSEVTQPTSGRDAAVAANTGAAATMMVDIDPTTATLLMLAEGLDQDARWLLQGGDDASLLAFAQ